jgi:dTDP-4-amino-4,6-dideoxygalactose transaminase
MFKEDDRLYPVSSYLSKKGLYLPSGTGLKASEIEFICNTIKEYYKS